VLTAIFGASAFGRTALARMALSLMLDITLQPALFALKRVELIA
jgi:hypothetical protein